MTQAFWSTVVRWSRQRGLHLLGLSLAASITASLLFAGWALLGDGLAALAALGSILAAVAILLLLGALAALGAWVAPMAHRTWLERLRLRMLELEHVGGQEPRIGALRRVVEGDHAAGAILDQGRLYFWIGAFLAPPAVALSLQASNAFGHLGDPLGFALFVTLPVAAVGLACLARGSLLLRDGRRLLRTIDPAPAKPGRTPRPPRDPRTSRTARTRRRSATATASADEA